MKAWRRLLLWLGWAHQPPDLSWRREPHFGPPNVIDLQRERLRRMPVVFVGHKSERQTPGRY